jgi:hypothetical protein
MQNRFVTLKEVSFNDNYWRSTGVHTYSANPVDSFKDFFFVLQPGTYAGDRKSPYPNEFQRNVIKHYKGLTIRDNPNEYNVLTGPIANTLPAYATGYSTQAYNGALEKFNERIRGTIDLSVDLLQGGQTTRMFRTALETVRLVKSFSPLKLKQYYKSFDSARREAKRLEGAYYSSNAAKRAISSTGGKWLEFQYGWKPLAQTIYDTTIELASALPHLMVVESTDKVVEVKQFRQAWFVDALRTDIRRQESSHRARFHAQYKFPAETTQLLGKFTSLNPANILWELTPYSFVVDWFLNVGGYLRNLESAMLYNSAFLNGYYTETVRTSDKSHAFGTSVSGVTTTTQDYEAETLFYAKRRTVLAFHPSPRRPRFEANLGSGRLLNAAALLSQFLR